MARLLQEEESAGWLEKWPGTWDSAVAAYGGCVAVGKLALAYKDDAADPRLVGDSSVSGASPAARFPERTV